MSDEQNQAVKAIVDACRKARTKDEIQKLRFESAMKAAAGIAHIECGDAEEASECFAEAGLMAAQADELEGMV